MISKIEKENTFYLLKYSDDAYENLHRPQLQELEQIAEETLLDKHIYLRKSNLT